MGSYGRILYSEGKISPLSPRVGSCGGKLTIARLLAMVFSPEPYLVSPASPFPQLSPSSTEVAVLPLSTVVEPSAPSLPSSLIFNCFLLIISENFSKAPQRESSTLPTLKILSSLTPEEISLTVLTFQAFQSLPQSIWNFVVSVKMLMVASNRIIHFSVT